MLKASLFIVLGVVAGAGLATLLDREPMPGLGGSTTAFDAGIGQTGDLSLRLTALEAALAEETARRESLEANLTRLEEQLGGLAPTESTNETRVVDLDEAVLVNPGVEGVRGPRSARFAAIREQRSPEYRQNRLVEAGFSPEQAQLLVDREAQMRMEIMNASYEARRQGESFNPSDLQRAAHVELRTELGTDAYERYLEATGQPTSVNIYEVIDNSAGKNAGLQTGDEIVGYNGERVYSLRDLRGLTIAGEPGETVTVDIVRDGQPMQLYMPRGPLGISGGGRGTSTAVFVP
jgi:hypothetical protein